MYKGNYAEISYQERKVEGHSLEKTPGREMLCDLNKVEKVYLLETVSPELLVIVRFSFACSFGGGPMYHSLQILFLNSVKKILAPTLTYFFFFVSSYLICSVTERKGAAN